MLPESLHNVLHPYSLQQWRQAVVFPSVVALAKGGLEDS